MPHLVAACGGWNEQIKILCGPGSVTFSAGPSVRPTYRTPPAESTVHMLHVDVQREIKKPEFSAFGKQV